MLPALECDSHLTLLWILRPFPLPAGVRRPGRFATLPAPVSSLSLWLPSHTNVLRIQTTIRLLARMETETLG